MARANQIDLTGSVVAITGGARWCRGRRNAGIMPTGLYIDEDDAMTDRMVDINVHGVLNGSKLAARRFAAQGRGHIVDVASLAGVNPTSALATYCGTKHFVLGFTEALHRELADQAFTQADAATRAAYHRRIAGE